MPEPWDFSFLTGCFEGVCPDAATIGTNDILAYSGFETSDGYTQISFVRKLVTSDKLDNPIFVDPVDITTDIIFAYGDDDFLEKHDDKGFGKIYR